MKELYIKAMRNLPKKFESNKTSILQHGKIIVASHPSYAALSFNGEEWEKIEPVFSNEVPAFEDQIARVKKSDNVFLFGKLDSQGHWSTTM